MEQILLLSIMSMQRNNRKNGVKGGNMESRRFNGGSKQYHCTWNLLGVYYMEPIY